MIRELTIRTKSGDKFIFYDYADKNYEELMAILEKGYAYEWTFLDLNHGDYKHHIVINAIESISVLEE